MSRPKSRTSAAAVSLVWTARALADLVEIDEYIGADDPIAAERWVGRLIATAEVAARAPLAGRVVPELTNASLREVFLRTYRIVYRVRPNAILVLTIFEGHRRFPAGIDTDE